MAVETLLDELLSMACGSTDSSELQSRLHKLIEAHAGEAGRVADEVRHTIQILRAQAKEMETLVFVKTHQRDLEQMKLRDWIDETAERASELRRQADGLERIAVQAKVIDAPRSMGSLRGIWEGADITEEEIKEVQRSWMKPINDFES